MCQHNLPCSIVYAHCLLPGRAFASLYVLLFLEKEAEIGGRAIVKSSSDLMFTVMYCHMPSLKNCSYQYVIPSNLEPYLCISAFVPLNELIESLPPEKREKWERLYMVPDRRSMLVKPLIYPHPVTKLPVSITLHTYCIQHNV